MMYALHQCAHFSADHHQEHGEAIVYLVRYLLKTFYLRIKFALDQTEGFECYVDADFCEHRLHFPPLKLNMLLCLFL